VEVEWIAPRVSNGVILKYWVYYKEVADGVSSSKEQETDNMVEIDVTSLVTNEDLSGILTN